MRWPVDIGAVIGAAFSASCGVLVVGLLCCIVLLLLLPCLCAGGRSAEDFVGTMTSPRDRGYNFPGVVRWFAERADVILLFFDPDKPVRACVFDPD